MMKILRIVEKERVLENREILTQFWEIRVRGVGTCSRKPQTLI
jgi:hypothetical protein